MISVLNIGFNNVYQIIMGRIFSINQVGYFYQAQKLQDVPNNIVNNLSQSVFYSTLSKKQNKIEELVKIYQLISRTSLSLMGLAVIIFLFFGQDIILVLFGDKWVESAYYIKFLICGSLFYTQELINKIIFKIFNKTRILLKLEIFKKLVHTATLLIGIYTRSIEIFMYGFIATNIFSYSFNYYQTNKIIKMGKDEIINFIKILMLISILSIINYYNYQTGLRSNLFSFCLIIIYCLSLNILNILKLKELKESK
jgi:O-antigen/teichoic acid export membrane protein